MGDIKFASSIVLIVLFTIAVLGYAVNFADENDSAVKLTDDETMSGLSGLLQEDLDLLGTNVNESAKGFNDEKVETGDDMMRTGGQFKLGVSSMVKSMSTIFSAIKTKIFGGSTALGVFLSALAFMLTYISIRYIWKTWKGGNPD